MAKSETFTFVCDKCQIEAELPKFLIKTMQHCPFCGARCNPPIDEVRQNINFGVSAWDALVKEYYQDK